MKQGVASSIQAFTAPGTHRARNWEASYTEAMTNIMTTNTYTERGKINGTERQQKTGKINRFLRKYRFLQIFENCINAHPDFL